MNNEQKKELEQLTGLSILKSLDRGDLSLVSIIKFSKQNNLFFDSYYEGVFVSSLATLGLDKCSNFLHYYEDFGLNLKQTGIIFENYFPVALDNFITEIKKTYNNNAIGTGVLNDKIFDSIKRSLNTKIILSDAFFEDKLSDVIIGELVKQLKDINQENFHFYLQNNINPKNEKPVSQVKI